MVKQINFFTENDIDKLQEELERERILSEQVCVIRNRKCIYF